MLLAWFALGISLFARQQAPQDTFRDLAQRAAGVLDSDPKQAADLCRQALAIDPSWAEGWFDLGAAEYHLGAYQESAKAFEQARTLAPEKGAVWAFLGLTQYSLNQLPQALTSLQRGESLGLPDNRGFVSAAHNTAALIFLRTKDFSEAIEQLRPLALLGEDSAQTITAFGLAALGLPYLPPDIPAGKRSLVQLAGRAEWAMTANHDREAAELLKQLVTQFPREPGVHYLNAMQMLTHDPEVARKELEKELQISPAHVAARLQIAILDIRADKPASASLLAREALRLQPDNALGHAVLARAYMQQDDYNNALPELQAAAKIAPLNPQIHMYLEQVYSRLGNAADAQKEKQEFVRLRSGRDSLGIAEMSPAGSKQ